MTREKLQNWIRSDYNEDTDEQLEYYINGMDCRVGSTAYLYSTEDDELTEMEIVHIIFRSSDLFAYDKLIEDDYILLDGEDFFKADTSAEFIYDDCCLVWFKYVNETEPGWDDDSDRGCKNCPDDECTGHCMSCYYRPV